MQVKLYIYIYINIYMRAKSAGPAEVILFIRKGDKMINDDIIKLELLSGHFQFCHLWSRIFTFLSTCHFRFFLRNIFQLWNFTNLLTRNIRQHHTAKIIIDHVIFLKNNATNITCFQPLQKHFTKFYYLCSPVSA